MFDNSAWFIYDSVSSTNTFAQQMALEQNIAEGSVIMAQFQEQGKGQRGNGWLSKPGENLLLSVVLYPTFLPVDRLFSLSQVAALSVSDTISSLIDSGVYIKWPNDIYVANGKIGGILIENTFRGQALHAAIVGIGVNVNQQDFGNELKHATSLYLQSGQIFNIKSIAEQLHHNLRHYYQMLKTGKFETINARYHEKLFRRNMHCSFKHDGIIFNGQIREVTFAGQLMVETSTGEKCTFDLKEIEMVI
jgi:BirA family biotin operon repressor/biotin-[acetyl-CoA-carboxylase] ligase